ncbi:MAG: TIGR00730 family Rossman fold protein [Cyclobacteriaceae bacterium]|nr:TIGR00730 family Rossman fold protein [Cyclobacteriaceae bacterium]
MNKRIAVFCGSAKGSRPEYVQAAESLGELFVRENIGLVYGGGSIGLMGVMADTMMALGGEVTGVIPQKIFDWEVGHTGITHLHVVQSMHERKAMMADLSDAFIAMPGGIGTLEEIIEVFTWLQLGYHHKACGFLNVGGYFDHLFAYFDHMVREGFLSAATRDLVHVSDSASSLLSRLITIR